MILEQNWKTLGPELRGNIDIYVGECDDYFPQRTHLLDDFFKTANPPADARITGAGRANRWKQPVEAQMMNEMVIAVEQGAKRIGRVGADHPSSCGCRENGEFPVARLR
jgi:hypothetical protein